MSLDRLPKDVSVGEKKWSKHGALASAGELGGGESASSEAEDVRQPEGCVDVCVSHSVGITFLRAAPCCLRTHVRCEQRRVCGVDCSLWCQALSGVLEYTPSRLAT